MTNASTASTAASVADFPFPPASLADFLQLCDGRWMSLRSTFALDGSDDWHNSERGEVAMRHQPDASGVTTLIVSDADAKVLSTLHFGADGGLQRQGEASLAGASGRWDLRQDGTLELSFPAQDGAVVLERLWFTKVNLRLRSTTLVDAQGTPQQASFCSEIRRVTAPSS